MGKYKSIPRGICGLCGIRPSNQFHHKFQQSKQNRLIYGKMLDEPFNLVASCGPCNGSHANIPSWAKWNEKQFREAALEKGFDLPMPLKSFKG
jgi:5-methylcytosine-specific restriction endonuclease McrA